ncbi:amidase [Nocardiopsis valliformis]|uniref:amidase n=1 Tax=Nocardiopsis valliformis TaxID=239974 RepID=UPI00034706D6|nr:amidase [Nocardiopsis valliformis]
MRPYEYADLDATALAAALRSGEVSPDEVETAARECLAKADADLNALTRPPFEPGLSHDPEGPLAGVPFVVKDSGPVAKGVPFSLGSRALHGAVAAADQDVMARFRAAGLVALGQSTAPELGLSFATESLAHGVTRNPWDPARGVGGSSGGAAALVAAGAVPFAHGNDGGGSIRVPASACGVVGLKPSRGRVPCGPLVGEAAFGLVCEFGLTRTVRDAALLLDLVGAPTVGEKHVAPPPPGGSHTAALHTDPGRLRIAVSTRPWAPTEVDSQVAEAARDAGRVLEWVGHTVTEDAPALDAEDVVEASVLAVITTAAALSEGPYPADAARMEAVPARLLTEARGYGALDVVACLQAQHRVTRSVGQFFQENSSEGHRFQGYDLLLTPTVAGLPVPHGTLDHGADHTVRSWLRRIYAHGPFTAPFNVSGNPAVSLPLAQSREGLPIGVQLVAAHGREDLLLAVAAQLEEAAPWRDRRPPLSVG